MKIQQRLATLIMICLALLVSTSVLAEGGLSVSDAWVREAPPGAHVQAGFVIIHNDSDQERKITAVRSPAFGSIEIHNMHMEDGMMRMQKQDTLIIPPNSTLKLEPGSFHLMLFDPVRYLKAGDSVHFTLSTGMGTCIDIKAPVKTGMGN